MHWSHTKQCTADDEALQHQDIFSKKILGMPRIKPRDAGCDARTLSIVLCGPPHYTLPIINGIYKFLVLSTPSCFVKSCISFWHFKIEPFMQKIMEWQKNLLSVDWITIANKAEPRTHLFWPPSKVKWRKNRVNLLLVNLIPFLASNKSVCHLVLLFNDGKMKPLISVTNVFVQTIVTM